MISESDVHMDILSAIAAIASCVTAIATAVTVIVAIRQFKRTLEENQKQIENERLNLIKNEALGVDAWIVLPKDQMRGQHSFVIHNETQGCLRNVEVALEWKSYYDATNDSCRIKLLPPGYWIISRNFDNDISSSWKFPAQISNQQLSIEYSPKYLDDSKHVLKEIWFTDRFGINWTLELSTRKLDKR